MESALLQGRVSFSPNVMQGPLQPMSKFFLGMCASQVQAPHFGVGAPNTWLPHLRGGICVCRQNSGFSSSLLFVDPCSDFCSFYLLVWGRPWGTGWGTCLILLLKKKKMSGKKGTCLLSFIQVPVCSRSVYTGSCSPEDLRFPVNPGIVRIFSHQKSLLFTSVLLVSP